MLDRGKPRQKRLEIAKHGRHLSLLEHNLRNPDGIEIGTISPGEIASMLVIPAKDGRLKAREGKLRQPLIWLHSRIP
jgi:hypothetical protein